MSTTGNRLLRDILGPNGPSRFDRDVLTQPGVTHVIILLGNNDIIRGQRVPDEAVTIEEIIQAHQMLIARAHLRGLKVYGATLTPFKGALDEWLFPAAEAQRQAVNHWIRTSGEYDAVVDFDLAVRWEADPAQLNPDLRADALHPKTPDMRRWRARSISNCSRTAKAVERKRKRGEAGTCSSFSPFATQTRHDQ